MYVCGIAGRQATEGLDVKLRRHVEQRQQETVDCRELIVQQRQAAEKLEEDVRLARRETNMALADKQNDVERLRTTV